MTNVDATRPGRRPRICVVSTTPVSVYFFFRGHLSQLRELGDVTLVVNPENDAYAPPLGLPIRVVPVGIRRPIAPLADLRALLRLARLFRSERFDLVWATAPKAGLLGMIAAWMTSVPLRVFVFQGEVWASKRGFSRWLLRSVDGITARCATHLLAVSDSERRFLEAEGVVPPEKVQVLGAGSISGVDLDRFRPDPERRAAMRAELGVPATAVVALFVGRLNADKGIVELAEAFRRAARTRPDLWLVVAGPDESGATGQLVDLLGEARDHLRVRGFTTRPEDFMAAADFLCLPSHREGFGLVIVEAGAAGIPAIGTRIPGISDAIREGETGLLFARGDAGELAAAMGRLADDEMLRRRLGGAARAYATGSFAAPDVLARFLAYFRGLL